MGIFTSKKEGYVGGNSANSSAFQLLEFELE